MRREGPEDILELEQGFDAIERDARALVSGLDEHVGGWRHEAGSWCVAECLDHLATANRLYLDAMAAPAERAVAQSRKRRRPARPGIVGGWFAWSLEPPVHPRFKMPSPRKMRPRPAPSLESAASAFFTSHDDVRAFLRRYADIDLVGTRFPNPFVRGVNFSLATGIHVIAAHERRHLWQAWRVRHAAEHALSGSSRS